MASFLLSEVYIVEKVLAAGHPDLDDVTCEATVCTSLKQAYYEATRSMITDAARDIKINCATEGEGEEEKNVTESLRCEEKESLRSELAKTMRRRGVTAEKRYLSLKEIIINASRAFGAELTYYTVKRSAIVPHREFDEETMIADALEALLGADHQLAKEKAGSSSGARSSANARQQQQQRRGDDPSLSSTGRGRGTLTAPLPANKDDDVWRKRAREHKH